MDEDIPFIVFLDGNWSSKYEYVDYEVKGLLIPSSSCSQFAKIKMLIHKNLFIDPSSKTLEIQYQVKTGYKPSVINNDNSWMFYWTLRKKTEDYLTFPLFVTTTELKCHDVYMGDTEGILGEYGSSEALSSHLPTHNSVLSKHRLQTVFDLSRNLVSSTMEELTNKVPEKRDNFYDININIISDKNDLNINVGQVYRDKETFVFILKQHALKEHYQFTVVKSNRKKYTVKCVDSNCSWNLKSKSQGESNLFQIKRFDNNHTCDPYIRNSDNRQASSDIIAHMFKDKFISVNTPYTAAHIMHELHVKEGIKVNYMKAYCGRKRALDQVRGRPDESFGLLPSYMHMLRRKNPGSIIELKTNVDNRFLYLFVALDVSIKGWRCCKPIIVVDGTFLTSKYKGTLMTASTQDAGNNLFVLAFAVVDSENNDSWLWFFQKFKDTFGSREGMLIISDRAKSIDYAATEVYTEATHCVCIYHLWNNLRGTFRRKTKKLRELFFGAAYAYTFEDFNHYMCEMDKISVGIRPYLAGVGFEKWSRIHATRNRGDFMTSNTAECFNSTISAAKELPVTALVDYLRGIIQRWTHENRQLAIVTVSTLTKPYQEKLLRHTHESLYMQVRPSNESISEVIDKGKRYIIHLEQKTCTCNRFQLDEFPCPHAIAVLNSKNKLAYEYCSIFYTNKMKLATYTGVVEPIGDHVDWEIPPAIEEQMVLPPVVQPKAGRPRKRRMKAAWERNKTKYHCGNCGIQGHNQSTCDNPPKN